MNQTVTYLQELTAIPSPTGFTREIADYLVKTIEGFGYEVTRTAKGGVKCDHSWCDHRQATLRHSPCGYLGGYCPRGETRWPPQAGPYRWFPLEYD